MTRKKIGDDNVAHTRVDGLISKVQIVVNSKIEMLQVTRRKKKKNKTRAEMERRVIVD